MGHTRRCRRGGDVPGGHLLRARQLAASPIEGLPPLTGASWIAGMGASFPKEPAWPRLRRRLRRPARSCLPRKSPRSITRRRVVPDGHHVERTLAPMRASMALRCCSRRQTPRRTKLASPCGGAGGEQPGTPTSQRAATSVLSAMARAITGQDAFRSSCLSASAISAEGQRRGRVPRPARPVNPSPLPGSARLSTAAASRR